MYMNGDRDNNTHVRVEDGTIGWTQGAQIKLH